MQGNLLDQAHARATDPVTSHIAAASVRNITELQQRIFDCLDVYGPLTDTELIEVYRSAFPHSKATEQSIRSRRKELCDDGLVRFSGDFGTTPSGRPSQKWVTR